jgi:hypothetical protein
MLVILSAVAVWRHGLIFNDWPMRTFGYSVLALLFASLVWVAGATQGRISRLLSHPTLVVFGKYSYCLYVFHLLVLTVCERWLGPRLFPVLLDFVVLDEFASMALEAWTEVLRPALSDRMGGALFIGTPKGRNHFYELFQAAPDQVGWAAFQYTTEQGGIVSLEELEAARRELDERTYRQEYQASFESQGTGIAYYAFDRRHNVRPLRYDPKLPLFWALDFNMNPLCSVVGQMVSGGVHILDELVLPDSHTLAACEEFLSRTKPWIIAPEPLELPEREDLCETFDEMLRHYQPALLNVYVYGDATGEQRRTAASRTDWQIARDFFGRFPDRFQVQFQVPRSNPPVKDRVNCVNAMLRNHAGQHRLLIDPKCKGLIKDFEQVCWKVDPHGNQLADLDKSDPMRTHLSDAAGYFLAREFPMRAPRGERGGPAII